MNILSGKKKWLLAAVIAIIGSLGAYMFLYPEDKNSEDKKPQQAIAMPRKPPHAVPPSVVPKATAPIPVAPLPMPAPSSAAAAATPPAPPAAVNAPPPVQSPLSKPLKPAQVKSAQVKPERSKSADLRYCLELETYQAIAKCAGE